MVWPSAKILYPFGSCDDFLRSKSRAASRLARTSPRSPLRRSGCAVVFREVAARPPEGPKSSGSLPDAFVVVVATVAVVVAAVVVVFVAVVVVVVVVVAVVVVVVVLLRLGARCMDDRCDGARDKQLPVRPLRAPK